MAYVSPWRWVPKDHLGKQWSFYHRSVLLGTVYESMLDDGVWICCNFRKGHTSGVFHTIRDAAKWLMGYRVPQKVEKL